MKSRVELQKKPGWDLVGVLFSGLCVIHCLAIPLVVLFFPAIGLKLFPQEDLTHVILLAFILGVAGVAFVSGYRVHGQWRPVAWMAVGLLIIVYATFFVHRQLGHIWEPIIAITGSLCLIRAHYLNHNCKKCEREHKHHEDSVHKHAHHSHGHEHLHPHNKKHK